MYIKMLERDAGKKQMIMTILNSMSTSERKEFLNKIYGMYADTDSIKIISSIDTADLMAIKNEFEQIHANIEALEVEIARIDDELDKTISSMNIDTVRIGSQADAIKKIDDKIKALSNTILVMKSYTSINPMSKTNAAIDKTLEDIFKES